MDRRTFLKGLLATSVAPAIVKSENIMRINPDIIVPEYANILTMGEVPPSYIDPMGRSLIVRGIPEGGSLVFGYTDPDTGCIVREYMTGISGGRVDAAIDPRVVGIVDIRTHAQGYLHGAYQVVIDKDHGADLTIASMKDNIYG